jgi:hypothetical protein
MVPIQLPVLGNLACRLLVKVLVGVACMKELSVPLHDTLFTALALAARQEDSSKLPPARTLEIEERVFT